MTPLRRYAPPSPTQPRAQTTQRWAAAFVVALCPLAASAQVRSDALRAADPASPVTVRTPAALAPTPATAPELPATAAEALKLWQRANQRVAEFPRGHIDILKLEAQNASGASPAGTQSTALPLLAGEALRLSLALRPELLARPGMGAAERARLQGAWLDHARAVQRAWIAAVASRESLRHQQDRLEAVQNGAELGRRMVLAGNWSQARQLRELLIQAREHAALLQARQTAMEAQEHLARLIGQWDAQAIDALMQRLPSQLPTPPARPEPGPGLTERELEAAVLRSHPKLPALNIDAQRQLATLSPAWRDTWTQALQTGLKTLPSDGLPVAPPHLNDLRLSNDHALERALGTEANLLEMAAERRSDARRAWARLQTAHALARHAQEVTLPLLVALEEDTLLRYNGMLKSTWDLLEASRERMQATSDAASARRDFWMARLDLDHLLAGGDYAPTESAAMGSTSSTKTDAGH